MCCSDYVDSDDISSREDWEEIKESVDEKDLLLRQTYALERILQQLQQLNGVEQSESETQYQCNQCGGVFTQTDLERHAKQCFGWMGQMGDVEKHFREIS
jgi:uncharacterized C2H2 Zn-finger protein